MRIRNAAFVENLQQDVHNIRVCFFDLIEEQNGIRAAAHLFGELTGFIVADIARGRADDLRDRVLFHELRHIEADERLRGIEQLFRKHAHKLGLAGAGGADEDERGRAAARVDLHAAAADGGGNSLDGLLLPHDVLAQLFFQVGKLAELTLLNLCSGNARPKLDDIREIRFRYRRGDFVRVKRGKLFFERRDFIFRFGKRFVIDILCALDLGFRLALLFELQICFFIIRKLFVAQRGAGACFVQQVDGLIRQVTVADISLGKHDDALRNLVGNTHVMVFFVVIFDAADDIRCVVDGRLCHGDGLEAALQCGVFFNVLAVLGERRCADDLNFSAGQRRL